MTDDDVEILSKINQNLNEYVQLLENCKERDALIQILNISRIGNQLMQAEKPWKLVKSSEENEQKRAYSVVSLSANISCLLAVLIEPFMPNLSQLLLEQLNANLDEVNVLNTDKEITFR